MNDINTILLMLIVIMLIYFLCKKPEAFEICYGKNDHLDQTIWGPGAWDFLHTVAFAFPEKPRQKDKIAAKNFVESFACILPCSVCKTHFKENIKKLPINVETRDKFFEWTVELHNLVNLQLGKPEWKVEDVRNVYIDKYKK